MKKVFETDWLASQPVFYNEFTGKVSHKINEVIEFQNFEVHPEGFNNYLDFGYSILEQTPIKHVKFLRHSSRLTVQNNGKLEIEYLDDPVEKWIGKTSHEDDIFHLLYSSVRSWEKSVEGEIIIPTSGVTDAYHKQDGKQNQKYLFQCFTLLVKPLQILRLRSALK